MAAIQLRASTDYESGVTSTVEIFIKDVGLVLQTGEATGTPLPLARAAMDMLRRAAAAGHGRDDDSAVIRAYDTGADNETA